MKTKGGRITIEFGSERISARGKASISPNRVAPKSDVNADGTGYSTVAPKLASASFSADRRLRVTDEMLLQEVNVTIRETDAGVTHLFTNARISWDGDIDTETGEVSSLKVESDSYQQV